jgi:hypothetical protein
MKRSWMKNVDNIQSGKWRHVIWNRY